MNICSKTDRGLVRSDNQDYCLSGKFFNQAVWAVVCDGMGGANGGHTASTTASEYIAREIKNLYTSDFTEEELIILLKNVVIGANLEVYNLARKNIELTGMGTTCEFLFIMNDKVHIIHVGDSRTYLIREKNIVQLTEDHSLVQEMVKRGEISKEEALVHPNKNFITRALGVKNNVKVDYMQFDYKQGDIIILCTDGLTNCVSDEKILEIVNQQQRKNQIASKLVDEANLGGGTDNITVMAIY